jgi:hypothetical protein
MEKKHKRLASEGKRKLHIDGKVWTYTVGRQNVRIVSPDQKMVEIVHKSIGEEHEHHYRVTPEDVSAYIEIAILNKPKGQIEKKLQTKHRKARLEYWDKNYPGVLTPEAREEYMETGKLDHNKLVQIVKQDIAAKRW